MESAMDILEIMRARHSVRQYTAEKIEPQKREALKNWPGNATKRAV